MKPVQRLLILAAALACLGAGSDPADRLANPAQEARARGLFREVRCLVCQGESIDDSDAELAGDLRKFVRAEVQAGKSDGAVRADLRQRYGDFVLFRPPFSLTNLILWLAPFAVALLAAAAFFRRRLRSAEADLDPEEQRRLSQLTGPEA